jgi:hypothetical protein
MTTIGPVIEKQQKIVNDCVEKKLVLSKLTIRNLGKIKQQY